MLLDPFEGQLHLPAGLVKPGDGQGGQIEVIGQEVEVALLLVVMKTDALQQIGKPIPGGGQGNGLIAPQTFALSTTL